MLHFDMFEKGKLKNVPKRGVVYPRDLKYLRRLYGSNCDRIRNYYLKKKFEVKNTQFISRFVEHIPLMLNSTIFEFMYMSDMRLEQLCDTFGVTTGTNKGFIHSNEFYANGGSEIIVSEYLPLDVKLFREDWKTYPCIRTLTHPRNDFKLLLPKGDDDGSKSGISMLAINFIALAAKYREFVKEQNIEYKNGNSPLSKRTFVMKYVLPGLVESDIDHRFLNHVIDRFYETKMVKPKFKHKFAIYEPTTQLDRYADDVLKNITDRKLSFYDIMFNVPLIFCEDMGELLAIDNAPDTIQNRWAYIVSRLKYMVFIYDVAAYKNMGTKEINDWKNLVKRIESERGLFQTFNVSETLEIRYYMDRIKNM